ncbi:hypothetical protein TNCV_2924991 [Trichonephila clavipes]|nr:hypothetical protein TNCV_2924991 [Trichonephila clavipes]
MRNKNAHRSPIHVSLDFPELALLLGGSISTGIYIPAHLPLSVEITKQGLQLQNQHFEHPQQLVVLSGIP